MAHLISNQTTQSYNQAFISIVSFWEHSIKSFMKQMTISSYHTLNNELAEHPILSNHHPTQIQYEWIHGGVARVA